MNLSEDEIKREILSFETGKMDEILSDLAGSNNSIQGSPG